MEFIDISIIKTNNQYLRLDTDVDKLKKSIETIGPIHPLVINLNNELISGGRRYTAMKELGFSEVPVLKVDRTEKEQELISIDENLVRKDLTKIELEKCLAKGRELYEELYPEAKKFEEEDLTTPEGNEIMSDAPNEQRSFIDLTAEKTGLSKKVIKSAIEREEKSSPKVKELRGLGELNASQANEIIKLEKEDQEHIVDLVKDKSAKEVKELVQKVNAEGLQAAVKDFIEAPQLPKEYKSLKTLLQRTNKVLAKILIEEMKSDHDEVHKILDYMSTLRMSLDQFLVLSSQGSDEQDASASEETYEEIVQSGLESLGQSEPEEIESEY